MIHLCLMEKVTGGPNLLCYASKMRRRQRKYRKLCSLFQWWESAVHSCIHFLGVCFKMVVSLKCDDNGLEEGLLHSWSTKGLDEDAARFSLHKKAIRCFFSSIQSDLYHINHAKQYLSFRGFKHGDYHGPQSMDQYKGSDVDKYRCFMSGESEKNTTWKLGVPPNFDVVNKLFEEGRTKIWPSGSLEEQVQNLVKTWEMEIFHKMKPQDFKTVDVTKLTVSVNGRKPLTPDGVAKIGGGYNMFLQTSLPQNLRMYDPSEETVDTAHKLFTTTFPRGFAVEILQVYSGPPVIAYKFRHWGYMEGPFKGQPPTGELVEMFGVSTMELDENFKIVKVEFFYDRGELLAGLMKGANVAGDSVTGGESSACPFS